MVSPTCFAVNNKMYYFIGLLVQLAQWRLISKDTRDKCIYWLNQINTYQLPLEDLDSRITFPLLLFIFILFLNFLENEWIYDPKPQKFLSSYFPIQKLSLPLVVVTADTGQCPSSLGLPWLPVVGESSKRGSRGNRVHSSPIPSHSRRQSDAARVPIRPKKCIASELF